VRTLAAMAVGGGTAIAASRASLKRLLFLRLLRRFAPRNDMSHDGSL